ncbi:MAG: DUF1016 N-terminal domain-containing protein, partial [Spirochaetes bacterium]|nr:DUF1016 N-terminal domain-containing protein [Spirochaetota bacterium]
MGRYIKSNILEGDRAEYGKRIVSTLSTQLVKKYGKSFTERNLYRMTLFAERFPDKKILPPLATKLSWSHILELLPLKTAEERFYYANDAAVRNLGKLELRHQ